MQRFAPFIQSYLLVVRISAVKLKKMALGGRRGYLCNGFSAHVSVTVIVLISVLGLYCYIQAEQEEGN